MPFNRTLLAGLFALVLGLGAGTAGAESRTVDLDAGVSMDLRVFRADSEVVLLGFPCDQGTGTAEVKAAERLAGHGIEVWIADLLSAHFLPIAPSSMRSLEGDEVADLIDYVHEQTGKRVILLASGYGSIPALRGARILARREGGRPGYLGGAILFYPKLYAEKPEPGKTPDYLPVVAESALDIRVLQPALSPERFWLARLEAALEAAGSRVEAQLIPGVRPFFYSRRDPTEREIATTERLDRLVLEALNQPPLRETTP